MSKATNNDERIRDLKAEIQKQIDEMPKPEKNYKTNLSLTFQKQFYNLNATDVNSLKELLIQLYLYNEAIRELALDNFTISGYSVEDWISDIKTVLTVRATQERLNTLRSSYSKVDSLLSESAKTEDYLNDLEKFLNS